jgi:SAM-dependent methyltransferase
MGQEQYNQWVQITSTNQQDNLCGGRQVSENEMYFIEKYAIKNILDIGCGTGHRTFPIWLEKKMNFYGIEKFQNLIADSQYKENILHTDISSKEFVKRVEELMTNKFDIAFLFGGVINGIIDRNLHTITWENFKFLLNKCEYILIDTLTHFPWFSTAEVGREFQLFQVVPVQYFYSKKELDKLNNELEFEFCEERTESIGNLKRTHYLIRKKKN